LAGFPPGNCARMIRQNQVALLERKVMPK